MTFISLVWIHLCGNWEVEEAHHSCSAWFPLSSLSCTTLNWPLENRSGISTNVWWEGTTLSALAGYTLRLSTKYPQNGYPAIGWCMATWLGPSDGWKPTSNLSGEYYAVRVIIGLLRCSSVRFILKEVALPTLVADTRILLLLRVDRWMLQSPIATNVVLLQPLHSITAPLGIPGDAWQSRSWQKSICSRNCQSWNIGSTIEIDFFPRPLSWREISPAKYSSGSCGCQASMNDGASYLFWRSQHGTSSTTDTHPTSSFSGAKTALLAAQNWSESADSLSPASVARGIKALIKVIDELQKQDSTIFSLL